MKRMDDITTIQEYTILLLSLDIGPQAKNKREFYFEYNFIYLLYSLLRSVYNSQPYTIVKMRIAEYFKRACSLIFVRLNKILK